LSGFTWPDDTFENYVHKEKLNCYRRLDCWIWIIVFQSKILKFESK
jgi:hypothetical protein